MVYYGKPSGGCHACRLRKTKCDQLRPNCTQCMRTRRECPGYRSEGDFIFRDETTKVEQKCKSRKVIPANQRPTKINGKSDSVSVIYSLSPIIEDRALGLFIANYATGMSGCSRGHMDYLEDLSRNEILGQGLQAAMKAVGLAIYAHRANAPSISQKARYQYLLAVQSTNEALRHPVEVKKDTTLVGIVVLGIYETIIGKKAGLPRYWIEHFNGAAAIIKLRGPEQLSTVSGRRIMITVCVNLLIAVIQRGVALPKHLCEYMDMGMLLIQSQNRDPAYLILSNMKRFANLRVDFINKAPDLEILRRSLDLDETLIQIASNHPPAWQYKTIKTTKKSPFVFNGEYHMYHDFWVAQIWNMLRTLRVLINELICDILKRLMKESCSPGYIIQHENSIMALSQMQLDILHSVPQHVGIFPTDDEPDIFQTHREFRMPMSASWYLLWPLWLAGLIDITTQEVKMFVICNLRIISQVGGIKEGDLLADLLEARNDCAEVDLLKKIESVSLT